MPLLQRKLDLQLLFDLFLSDLRLFGHVVIGALRGTGLLASLLVLLAVRLLVLLTEDVASHLLLRGKAKFSLVIRNGNRYDHGRILSAC